MQNNQQALQSIQQARNIINQLKQAEQRNSMSANKLADMEAGNEFALNQNDTLNAQAMAQREGQAAGQLQNLAHAEKNATHQLDQLNQILSQLESKLR
jgi:hypothetical protein